MALFISSLIQAALFASRVMDTFSSGETSIGLVCIGNFTLVSLILVALKGFFSLLIDLAALMALPNVRSRLLRLKSLVEAKPIAPFMATLMPMPLSLLEE